MKISFKESRTSDQLLDLHAAALPQQPHQSLDAVAALDGHLVVVVLAVGDVAQGAAGLAVHLGLGVVQQLHQHGHAAQLPHLLLDAVVLIAQVLQVGGGVGLDRVHGVAEHGDDLVQVGISPAWVSADAVQAHHAVALVGEVQRLRSTHGLEERVEVAFQLRHEGVVVAAPEETARDGSLLQLPAVFSVCSSLWMVNKVLLKSKLTFAQNTFQFQTVINTNVSKFPHSIHLEHLRDCDIEQFKVF